MFYSVPISPKIIEIFASGFFHKILLLGGNIYSNSLKTFNVFENEQQFIFIVDVKCDETESMVKEVNF